MTGTRGVQATGRSSNENDQGVGKVLLIGDALTTGDGLAHLLEKSDESVVLAAPNAAAGLRLLREEKPTVVIVDHQLEDGDGVSVLSQVRSQAAHCGTIVVTSTGGMDVAIDVMRAGALDCLSRPVDAEQLMRALARARERRTYRRPHDPPSILVLEDHVPTQTHLKRTLEKEGYRVLAGHDGDEGLRLFAEHEVDIILADLQMPGMSGLEVLEKTKGCGADVEVVLVTAHGDESTVIRALRFGAVDFLRKPVDVELMLRSLQEIASRGISVSA